MPRYFFNVHGETSVVADLVGRDLPDDQAARAVGTQLAKEVVVDEVLGGRWWGKVWVELIDQSQRPFFMMPVTEMPSEPTRLA